MLISCYRLINIWQGTLEETEKDRERPKRRGEMRRVKPRQQVSLILVSSCFSVFLSRRHHYSEDMIHLSITFISRIGERDTV